MAHQPSADVASAPDLEAAFRDAAAGRRVKVRRGRKTVGVVPARDLDRLEAMDEEEDRLLAQIGRAALEEFRASGEEAVSLEEVRRRLGLDG